LLGCINIAQRDFQHTAVAEIAKEVELAMNSTVYRAIKIAIIFHMRPMMRQYHDLYSGEIAHQRVLV
jgi:hypothetical protein